METWLICLIVIAIVGLLGYLMYWGYCNMKQKVSQEQQQRQDQQDRYNIYLQQPVAQDAWQHAAQVAPTQQFVPQPAHQPPAQQPQLAPQPAAQHYNTLPPHAVPSALPQGVPALSQQAQAPAAQHPDEANPFLEPSQVPPPAPAEPAVTESIPSLPAVSSPVVDAPPSPQVTTAALAPLPQEHYANSQKTMPSLPEASEEMLAALHQQQQPPAPMSPEEAQLQGLFAQFSNPAFAGLASMGGGIPMGAFGANPAMTITSLLEVVQTMSANAPPPVQVFEETESPVKVEEVKEVVDQPLTQSIQQGGQAVQEKRIEEVGEVASNAPDAAKESNPNNPS